MYCVRSVNRPPQEMPARPDGVYVPMAIVGVWTFIHEDVWQKESLMRKRFWVSLFAVVALVGVMSAFGTRRAEANRGHGALGVVYVTGQGLYYDTFVSAQKLPPHGPFQLLVNGETAFGPGDPGYVGGRWKILNSSGGYDYLLCPLLPPGREEP
jgi:hypothetical protein